MKDQGHYDLDRNAYHRIMGNAESVAKMRLIVRAITFALLSAFLLPACCITQFGDAACAVSKVELDSQYTVDKDVISQGLITPQTKHIVIIPNSLAKATAVSAETTTQEGYINAKSLNMRSKPDRKSSIVKEYFKGQTVEILGKDGDWYKVRVDGKTGYMLKKYVTLASSTKTDDSATAGAQAGYVNAKSLNMRSKPNRKGSIVEEYKKGQAVEIVGESGDWYKVVVAGATGYMLKEYVSIGSAPTRTEKPSTRTATKTEEPQDTPTKTEKPTRTEAPTPTEKPISRSKEGKYVGSSEKDKFHKPTCRWAKEILPENEVWWNSREEAIAAGRKACKVCNP